MSYFVGNLAPNTYNLTVIVTDTYGRSDSHSVTITIEAPPVLVTTSVTTGTTSTVASVISVSGSTTNTLTSTVTDHIEQIFTKTAEGFGIVLAILSMLGGLFIARRRHR